MEAFGAADPHQCPLRVESGRSLNIRFPPESGLMALLRTVGGVGFINPVFQTSKDAGLVKTTQPTSYLSGYVRLDTYASVLQDSLGSTSKRNEEWLTVTRQ